MSRQKMMAMMMSRRLARHGCTQWEEFMKPWELFNLIKSIKHEEYITSGDDVQWTVKVDDVEKVVRLIFEESCGNTDWKNNLNFPMKLYKKQESCIRAARGWGNAYKSCNDEIMQKIIFATEIAPDYQIHICGWSYGGAVALLAAEDFHYRTGKKASVYTFGAPKPLWGKKTREYVRSCVNEVKQYSHVNDCVPLMPPLPGYTRLSTDHIGGKRNFFKLFNPCKYHCIYGEESLYKE